MYRRDVIGILPQASRTFVTILTPDDVYQRLRDATTWQTRMQNKVSTRKIAFVGSVQPGKFSISLKVSRPNSFLPLIKGTIEPTQSGCLLFMKASLFPSTRTYLIFWLLFILVAGVIVSGQYESPLVLAAPLLLDLAILWISWANFKMQLRLTIRVLDDVLNAEN